MTVSHCARGMTPCPVRSSAIRRPPVTLGEGNPLFKRDSEPLGLELLQPRPLGDRCLLLRYRPAGVAAAARPVEGGKGLRASGHSRLHFILRHRIDASRALTRVAHQARSLAGLHADANSDSAIHRKGAVGREASWTSCHSRRKSTTAVTTRRS